MMASESRVTCYRSAFAFGRAAFFWHVERPRYTLLTFCFMIGSARLRIRHNLMMKQIFNTTNELRHGNQTQSISLRAVQCRHRKIVFGQVSRVESFATGPPLLPVMAATDGEVQGMLGIQSHWQAEHFIMSSLLEMLTDTLEQGFDCVVDSAPLEITDCLHRLQTAFMRCKRPAVICQSRSQDQSFGIWCSIQGQRAPSLEHLI